MNAIMRRVVLTVAVCLFLPLSGYCQSDDEIGKIAAFLGVISEEDLSEDEVEYFTDLIRKPLKILQSTEREFQTIMQEMNTAVRLKISQEVSMWLLKATPT